MIVTQRYGLFPKRSVHALLSGLAEQAPPCEEPDKTGAAGVAGGGVLPGNVSFHLMY
ncbi:hypothetical protein ACNF49_23760 [Actinomadura sp. ATCC 39365]